MIAKNLISDNLSPLHLSDTIDFALSQMEEFRISQLPVIDDLDFIGLISDTDLYNVSETDKPIGELKKNLKRIYIDENQHIFDVLMLFSTHHLSVLPVLSFNNHYAGMITASNLIYEFASLSGVNNPGGVIILEVSEKDFVLSEIARIVEANDAKVISLCVNSHPDSTMLEVTMKVNKIEIGPILQTFTRYNYLIKATFSEDSYSEDLIDRYNSLMNYLRI